MSRRSQTREAEGPRKMQVVGAVGFENSPKRSFNNMQASG
jgi:hypothetical protein